MPRRAPLVDVEQDDRRPGRRQRLGHGQTQPACRAGHGGQQTIDDVIDKGMFICGSPETVRQRLEQYQSEIGFGHLLTLLQFGTLPAELTRKNMELYATSVMPWLRERRAARTQVAAE
jgi:alkanesulfonate monooxygenase SsuD/methylene tetrahydromethanopterin reductase-like flavin-dependent oxidoreductase (luciferase family)